MSTPHKIDPDLLDAAVRSGFGAGSAEERAHLEAWLAEHPDKSGEWQELQKFWQNLATLPVDPAELRAALAPTPRHRDALRVFGWSLASAAAVAAVAVVGWFSVFSDRSDPPLTVFDTARGHTEMHVLADGSRVDVSADSHLEIQFGERERRITMHHGEALFTVAKDAARPFVVTTALGDATAIGTQFEVRTDAARTTVAVAEGVVRVDATGPDTDESPHEAAMVSAGQLVKLRTVKTGERSIRVVERADIEPSLIAAWRWGRLQFDGVPLAEAAVDVNRHSAELELRVSGAAANIPIYGVFETGDVRGFAKVIEDRLAADPSIHGGVEVIEIDAPK